MFYSLPYWHWRCCCFFVYVHPFVVSRLHAPSTSRRNEDYEKLAFAYNAGGPDEVVARSQRLVDPDVLADHGDGFFPLYYAPLARAYLAYTTVND